jgi:hypothetical protein
VKLKSIARSAMHHLPSESSALSVIREQWDIDNWLSRLPYALLTIPTAASSIFIHFGMRRHVTNGQCCVSHPIPLDKCVQMLKGIRSIVSI